MRPMRSAQRQVELSRLGNQLSVLGKAESRSCKLVKCCVCLFVKLRLSPGRVEPRDKDIPGYSNSGKIHVASRRFTKVPVAPLAVGKNTNFRFLRFFVHSVPLFRSLMLTPMHANGGDFVDKKSEARNNWFYLKTELHPIESYQWDRIESRQASNADPCESLMLLSHCGEYPCACKKIYSRQIRQKVANIRRMGLRMQFATNRNDRKMITRHS